MPDSTPCVFTFEIVCKNHFFISILQFFNLNLKAVEDIVIQVMLLEFFYLIFYDFIFIWDETQMPHSFTFFCIVGFLDGLYVGQSGSELSHFVRPLVTGIKELFYLLL